MSKIILQAIVLGCLFSGSAISQTLSDVSNMNAKAELAKNKVALSKAQAEFAIAETRRIEAEENLRKTHLKISTGTSVGITAVQTDENVKPDKSGYLVVSKAEPIDSVCVTRVGGSSEDLNADLWFRGVPVRGIRAGEMLPEGVRVVSLHTSRNRGWGVEISHIGQSRFVTMCDEATAMSRGVPEKRKVF